MRLWDCMHATILFFAYWAVAFVSLCAAVFLLGIFYNVINNDLGLLSLGKELMLAGVASLLEGVSVWLVVSFISATYRPMGLRAMFVPLLAVGLIYKIAHLEDWSRYEAVLLIVFQMAICLALTNLILGHFATALFITLGLVVALAVIASVAKGL